MPKEKQQHPLPLFLEPERPERPSTMGITLRFEPKIGDTVGGPTIRHQQGALLPLNPTLQQGFSDSIKTSLEPVGLTSSQHQPGLN